MESLSRQNFSVDIELGLNKQINRELYASYVYMSIAAWCDRDSVALKGLQKYCLDSSLEERGHAQRLIDYVNQRGGKVTFDAIQAPPQNWTNTLQVMEAILNLEKSVNQHLLDLHANGAKDPQFQDFIESNYLIEQVEEIKAVADKIATLKRCGEDGLGLHLWDRELLESCKGEDVDGGDSDSD